MGRHNDVIVIRVHTTVSRHNSAQDAEDDALVAEVEQRLTEAVQAITRDPQYARVLD